MEAVERKDLKPANDDVVSTAQEIVKNNFSNELVFAVVGHVGSGTSEIANRLSTLLSAPQMEGGAFDVNPIKVSRLIKAWAKLNGKSVPTEEKTYENVTEMQNLGDEMRRLTNDYATVAECILTEIQSVRKGKPGVEVNENGAAMPNGVRRAYIIDALRHPTEVQFLRQIYQEAFILIGVVCDEDGRQKRLSEKYTDSGIEKIAKLMKRDSKSSLKYGQRVADAFHLSDFFIDNSQDRILKNEKPNENWHVIDDLSRLVKIITHDGINRPWASETAMHYAHSASLRSSCLSRQVGAALVDDFGNVIATGSNEVPKAGGGVYGQSFEQEADDQRCFFANKSCSNTSSQNELVQKLINGIDELSKITPDRRVEIEDVIKSSGVGDLLEFSRAVHAEMDALLTAGRSGKSTSSCRLFVTTFPCHYCARHIVSSGVDEVQYIEPYPKSRALKLHKDSITADPVGWIRPSRSQTGKGHVLFRPFVGVAPRMYQRAFIKDRELKDRGTGVMKIQQPDWGAPWELRAKGYSEMEAVIVKRESVE